MWKSSKHPADVRKQKRQESHVSAGFLISALAKVLKRVVSRKLKPDAALDGAAHCRPPPTPPSPS